MKNERLLQELEGLAHQLGISIRHFKFPPGEPSGHGGLCRIRGKPVLFIDSLASTREKILVLQETLRNFNWKDTPLRPEIIKLLYS